MTNITIEHQDKVAVLRLNKGTTNPLNLEFIKNISANLQDIKDDPSIISFVITSENNKFFSIGFDIPELYELDREGMSLFYKNYNRLCLELYTLPKPTVAAITGHAIAGGCILALCCDLRFIADDRKLMGLNEVKLGVPVPYPGDCILKQLVGSRNARDVMEIGEFYEPDDLLKMGMVDRILPLDEVLPKSIEKARILGEMPSIGFSTIKQNRVEIIEAHIKKYLKEKEEIFLDCWFSSEARKQLKEAIKKF